MLERAIFVGFAQEPPPFIISVGGGIYFDAGIPMWEDTEGAVIGVGRYGFVDFTYTEIDVGIGYYRLTDAGVYGMALNNSVLANSGIYPLSYYSDVSFENGYNMIISTLTL